MAQQKSKKTTKSRRDNRDERFELNGDEIMAEMEKGTPASDKEKIRAILLKKPFIKFKTENQKLYSDVIDANDIIFCAGPAGTGKSYISAFKALALLFDPMSPYTKIIVTKPTVEVDSHGLGYLPGGIDEKLGPYVYSSIDVICKIIGKPACDALIKGDFIRCAPIAYMRGITMANCVFIGEECQNMSSMEMKTVLTRIGEGAKFILSGDLEQSDRFQKDPSKSGLGDAMNRLKDIDGIGYFYFGTDDIVRHPIIKKILERYKA